MLMPHVHDVHLWLVAMVAGLRSLQAPDEGDGKKQEDGEHSAHGVFPRLELQVWIMDIYVHTRVVFLLANG